MREHEFWGGVGAGGGAKPVGPGPQKDPKNPKKSKEDRNPKKIGYGREKKGRKKEMDEGEESSKEKCGHASRWVGELLGGGIFA